MSHVSAKERLDSILGIKSTTTDSTDKETSNNQPASIDEYLKDLELSSNLMQEIDSEVKSAVKTVDEKIEHFDANSLVYIQDAMNNINKLISTSRDIIQHLYTNIVSTDLIDTELINATAAFIEVSHQNTKEYIELYKDRIKFLDRIKLEMIQLENKKELMRYKQELDIEKYEKTKGAENVIDATAMVSYTQEDIVKLLSESDEVEEVEPGSD